MGLHRLLRSWERRRLLAAVPDLVSKSTAQLNQDLWAIAETKRKRGGFFVEIGAFDGIRHSNTYLLEKEFGWNGILVEPNPAYRDHLSRHRSAAISTSVIYSKRTSVDFICVQDEPELSTIAVHGNDDRHGKSRRGNAAVTSLQAITLHDLLGEHHAPREIDYMSIDTEGSEREILSAFNFDTYRIGLMSVEHNNTRREWDIERLLRGNGFKRVFRRVSRFDAWYRRV